jgi:hypothetical protein
MSPYLNMCLRGFWRSKNRKKADAASAIAGCVESLSWFQGGQGNSFKRHQPSFF